MTRLIDADAVYKILESCEIRKATIGNPLTDWEYGYTCGIERGESEIECAPTVDAVPIRHGHWQITDAYPHNVHCSVCHKRFAQTQWAVWEDGSLPRNYCPHCGARMDEK